MGRSSLNFFCIEPAPSYGGDLDDSAFTSMRTTFLAPDILTSFDRGEEYAELHGIEGGRGIVEDMLKSLAPIPASQWRHPFEVGAGAAGAGEQRLDPRHDPALLGKGRKGDRKGGKALSADMINVYPLRFSDKRSGFRAKQQKVIEIFGRT